MQTTLIIFQGILIFFFLLAGLLKLVFNMEKLIANGGTWAEDVSAGNIKITGIFESFSQ